MTAERKPRTIWLAGDNGPKALEGARQALLSDPDDFEEERLLRDLRAEELSERRHRENARSIRRLLTAHRRMTRRRLERDRALSVLEP